jgi:hypothetical protein
MVSFVALPGLPTLEEEVEGDRMLASTPVIGFNISFTSSVVPSSGRLGVAIVAGPVGSVKEEAE